MKRIELKPLSTNDAWKGKQFSTKMKTEFENKLRKEIKDCVLEDCIAPYEIHFRFGIPKRQDYDNSIKVTQDILCEHFGINDCEIYKAIIEKIPVKKGKEYIEVDIKSYEFK